LNSRLPSRRAANLRRVLIVPLLGLMIAAILPMRAAEAAGGVTLTVTPITWDIVGLDSNNVNTGPSKFSVGSRVCNTGSVTASLVTATFAWTSANTYITLEAGTNNSVSLGALTAGACADAYFNVEITRSASAYNQSRRYTVTATDSGTGTTATSPTPRQIYVEYLVSQNRNSVTSMSVAGASIPAGGTADVVVGGTYTIVLSGATSTQGYEQFQGFLGFPNNAFEIKSVSTTFSADTSPLVSSPEDSFYLDACGWDADPSSPNYRSCSGSGKAGGTVVVTYTVKILSGAAGTYPLNAALYDFSGSSFHYNADYGTSVRYLRIAGAESVGFTKSFNPKSVTPNTPSTLTFTLANPNATAISGVNFVDPLPTNLVVASTPTVTINGCGSGTFSPTPVSGATSLSFSGGTIAANSKCTISVKVTSSTDGTYTNTTQNLFIEGSTDTGRTATDSLIVKTAAACTENVVLAKWTVPSTATNPPDTTGGVPTTKSSQVSTATAAAKTPADTSITTNSGSGDTYSWNSWGYKNAGQQLNFTVDTSQFTKVQMSFNMAVPGGSTNGPTSVSVGYVSGGTYTALQTVSSPSASFSSYTQDFTNNTNTSGNTVFRITGSGALNDQSGANVLVDNIELKGCAQAVPAASIAKAFSPTTIQKGSTSNLTFTLDNTAAGSVALTGLSFSDAMPTGLTLANASTSGCGGTVTTTAATGVVALSGGSLAAGASCSFSVTVTGSTSGVKDNVSGFLSSTETGETTNYATASVTVVAPPNIGKSFSPASVATGTTSTLAFVITNPNADSSLSGIAVSDTLPSGLTVTTGSASACGGTVTRTALTGVIALTGGSLAAGASCTFSVTVTGSTSGVKTNTTGTISSTEGGTGSTATASIAVVDLQASLDLQKEASTSSSGPWRKSLAISAGDDVYYQLTLYNSGEVSLTNLTVSDPDLPAADLASCSWPATLAVGESANCVIGPVTATSGSVDNTASATATRSGGATVNSNSSIATYSTTELTLDKYSSSTSFAYEGETITYNYSVTNTGFIALLGPVTVTDDKATVTCPAISTLAGGGNYLEPGMTLTCSASYTITSADITAESVTNTASASADGTTSNSDSLTLPYDPVADLAVVKTVDPASAEPGDSVTFTVRVTNNGPSSVTGATLDDPSVTGLTKTAVTCSTVSSNECVTAPSVAGLEAGFALPALADGEFYELTITATLDAVNGTVTNTASVAVPAGTTDPDPSNDSDDVDVTVDPVALVANFVLTKRNTVDVVQAGSIATYIITVVNEGPSTVGGATLRDPDMPGLTKNDVACVPVAENRCSSAPTIDELQDVSGAVVPALAEGQFYEISVTARVDANSGSVTNTATVTLPAGVIDPSPENHFDAAVTPVVPGTPSDLPITGAQLGLLLVAAVLLLGVGFTLALPARRRN
jgi:uncharacterized repeat protein (TIGR01451 family)